MQPTDDLPVDVWRRVPGDGGAVAFGWLCGRRDRRVLVAHCDGAPSVDSFFDIVQTMADDPEIGPVTPILWDLRGHDLGKLSADVVRQYAHAMQRASGRRGARRGFLVDSDVAFGMMRMFEQTAVSLGFEDAGSFRVSRKARDLLAWLESENPSEDPSRSVC